MSNVTPGWRRVYDGIEAVVVPALGIDPWKAKWRHASPDKIIVSHPAYPEQRHQFSVYELDGTAGTIRSPQVSTRTAFGASTFHQEWPTPTLPS